MHQKALVCGWNLSAAGLWLEYIQQCRDSEEREYSPGFEVLRDAQSWARSIRCPVEVQEPRIVVVTCWGEPAVQGCWVFFNTLFLHATASLWFQGQPLEMQLRIVM